MRLVCEFTATAYGNGPTLTEATWPRLPRSYARSVRSLDSVTQTRPVTGSIAAPNVPVASEPRRLPSALKTDVPAPDPCVTKMRPVASSTAIARGYDPAGKLETTLALVAFATPKASTKSSSTATGNGRSRRPRDQAAAA